MNQENPPHFQEEKFDRSKFCEDIQTGRQGLQQCGTTANRAYAAPTPCLSLLNSPEKSSNEISVNPTHMAQEQQSSPQNIIHMESEVSMIEHCWSDNRFDNNNRHTINNGTECLYYDDILEQSVQWQYQLQAERNKINFLRIQNSVLLDRLMLIGAYDVETNDDDDMYKVDKNESTTSTTTTTTAKEGNNKYNINNEHDTEK